MSLAGDPVSWFMIEPGWKVVASDGATVGSVAEVVGDEENDIFNGLAVATGLLGRARYVEAERVARITDGCLELTLAKSDVSQLPEFQG